MLMCLRAQVVNSPTRRFTWLKYLKLYSFFRFIHAFTCAGMLPKQFLSFYICWCCCCCWYILSFVVLTHSVLHTHVYKCSKWHGQNISRLCKVHSTEWYSISIYNSQCTYSGLIHTHLWSPLDVQIHTPVWSLPHTFVMDSHTRIFLSDFVLLLAYISHHAVFPQQACAAKSLDGSYQI